MNAAVKPHTQRVPPARHEPEERADPVANLINVMLGQVDDMMRSLIANGGEGALRSLVEKHFPPAAAKQQTREDAQTRRVDRIVADGETALGLSYCLEVLRKHMHRLGPTSETPRAMTQTGIATLLAALKQPAPAKSEGEV